jgi:hypothetical protein
MGCLTSAQAAPPVIHGIISQGFLKSSDYSYLAETTDGTFAYSEVLLNVSARMGNRLRVGAQMMGRNLGADGNEDLVLDWAFGDYRVADQLGVRVGKIKTPHGLYNQTRDVDMVRNSILLPQVVYTEVMRDVMNGFEGASLYGTVALGSNTSLEYDAFYGTVDVERTRFPVDMVVTPLMTNVYTSPLPYFDWRAEVKRIYGGALRLNTPLEGLRLGASAFDAEMSASGVFASPFGAFRPEFHMQAQPWYVLSAEYTRDALTLSFEMTRAFIEMEMRGLVVPTGMADPAFTTMDIPMEDRRGGWYGQVVYRLNDWCEVGGYYAQFYPDYGRRDLDGPQWQQRDIALSARFDITDYWLIKAEAHLMTGNGDVQARLNPDADFDVEDWNLFGVKSTFFF